MVRPTKCGQIHLLYSLSGAFPTSRHSVEVLSAFMVLHAQLIRPKFNHILQQNDHRLLSWFVSGDLIERPPSSPDVSATTQLDTSKSFQEKDMFISYSFLCHFHPERVWKYLFVLLYIYIYIYIYYPLRFDPLFSPRILQLSCLIASCFSFPYLSQVVM